MRMNDTFAIRRYSYFYNVCGWQGMITGQYPNPRESSTRTGKWYWAVTRDGHPGTWNGVQVSDESVPNNSPLKTPDWANGVVWLRD